MAVGSLGSDLSASAIQARKTAQGSPASVKSPFVNASKLLFPRVVFPVVFGLPCVTNSVARRVYRWFRIAGEARLRACLAVAFLGALAGGCSMSFPMASLLPENDTASTGSLEPKLVSPLSAELGPEDWRRAKGALAVALDPQGNGSAVSWENPDSGFKGAFTPLGRAFVKGDEICRAFRASLDGRNGGSSVQGTACRPSGGDWAVKEVKPAKKTG
jgi:surface antigen